MKVGSAGFEPAVTNALAFRERPEARMLTKLHHDPDLKAWVEPYKSVFPALKEIVLDPYFTFRATVTPSLRGINVGSSLSSANTLLLNSFMVVVSLSRAPVATRPFHRVLSAIK